MNESVKKAMLLSFGVLLGGTAGYFVTKQILSVRFDEDLKDVKEYYKLLRKDGEFSSPETVPTAKYEDVLLEYQGGDSEEELEDDSDSEDEHDIEEAAVVDTIDYVDELDVANRSADKPYLISVDEYMQDLVDTHDKNTVTYFEEDDVLCDERESVIPEVEKLIGTEALTKFGTGSNNEKVVYVRNEAMSSDFEVILDTRSFAEVVLGFKEENELRRMRDDD